MLFVWIMGNYFNKQSDADMEQNIQHRKCLLSSETIKPNENQEKEYGGNSEQPIQQSKHLQSSDTIVPSTTEEKDHDNAECYEIYMADDCNSKQPIQKSKCL